MSYKKHMEEKNRVTTLFLKALRPLFYSKKAKGDVILPWNFPIF